MPEQDGYQLQYDAQGRPFFWVNGKVGGAKRYVSPVSFGEKPPEDTTGPFRQRPQWNAEKGKFETPIDWSNILNVAIPTAIGASYVPWGSLGGAGIPGAPGALGTVKAVAKEGAKKAGKGALGWLKDPKNLVGLSGIIASLVAAKKLSGDPNGGEGGPGGNDFLTPDMQRYQAMSEARFRRSDPLHEAVSQLAFQRMPIQGREGLSLPRVPLPEK